MHNYNYPESVNGMPIDGEKDSFSHKQKYGLQGDEMESMAVIGFSTRFPQDATSSEAFWEMLREGRSAMTEVPKDRFNVEAFYHPNPRRMNSINSKGGHYIKDTAAFDAPFFSITPAEAASMDPQQRGLLETTYKAFENAGLTLPDVNDSKTSVHIGCFTREYELVASRDPEMQSKYQATGSGYALLANRLSWFYNLHGPSLVLDTACSSSLNALHLGFQSLRHGEAKMGVVGGCNLLYNPDASTPLSNLNFLSPDSRCYSFDSRANGYARGEGFGIAIIKLLSDAIRDGDTIRAVVRATGSNQDGRTPGITQPSRTAQENLIRDTYNAAGLDLKTTRYFEAHGTGTAVGDPIEAGAINTIFSPERSLSDPLFVGAVKSNIGHLEGASGIAGLFKTIMVLEKAIIPPNFDFRNPNPKIPINEWPIKFPTEPTVWPGDGLRRASVNSFGYGGANVHVVLDDAYNFLKLRGLVGNHCTVKSPPSVNEQNNLKFETSSIPLASEHGTANIDSGSKGVTGHDGAQQLSSMRLLVWSTSDEAGLRRTINAYRNHAFDSSYSERDGYFDCLAYTLSSKRTLFPWRSFAIANSINDLRRNLENKMSKPIRSSHDSMGLGFVFSGQGAAWPAMGRGLSIYPEFRSSLQAAEKYFRSLGSNLAVIDELERNSGDEDANFTNSSKSQPLCTALQIALVNLLRHWNIHPTSVVGHSSGEIAAAYCVGGISQESAWKIAYYRGILAETVALSSKDRGAMLSVGLSETDIQPYLQTMQEENLEISIGCVNSPKNVTLTGREDLVDALHLEMDRKGVFARKLNVDVAYHSGYMETIAAEYRAQLQDIVPENFAVSDLEAPAMFSSVSGQPIPVEQLSQADYWVQNLVSRVKFSDALTRMCSESNSSTLNTLEGGMRKTAKINDLLEVGPHSVLRSAVREVLKAAGKINEIKYTSLLLRKVSAMQTCLETAGNFHCRGYPVNLNNINNPHNQGSHLRMLTDLPEYPFNHSQKYWLESRLSSNFRFRKYPRHELLGTAVADWNQLEAKWRNFLKVAEHPWIKDHVVKESQMYPASGMIVMAIEAARQLVGSTPRILKGYRVKDTTFQKALIVPSTEQGIETNFFLRPRKDNSSRSVEWSDFRLCSYQNEEWKENCRGVIGVEFEQGNVEVDDGREAVEELETRRRIFRSGYNSCKRPVNPKQLYEVLSISGYQLGPAFQTLHEIFSNGEDEATATLNLSDWASKIKDHDIQEHVIHPTSLDGVLQTSVVVLTKGGTKMMALAYPTRIRDLWISNDLCSAAENKIVKISAISTLRGFREIETSIVTLDSVHEEPRIVIQGFESTALSNTALSSLNQPNPRRLCYKIAWKPDLDLMTHDQVSEYCKPTTSTDLCKYDQINEDLELTCLLFIARALQQVSSQRLVSSKPHFRRYHTWMKHQMERFNAAEMIHERPQWRYHLSDEPYQEQLFDRIENQDPEGKLIVVIGKSLTKILHEEVDPLEVLFRSDLASNFYRYSNENDPNYRRIAGYLDLLAHKNPGLRVLEIGAGTGGATAPILHALCQHGDAEIGQPRFSQYMFTDISPGFFEKAKQRFQGYGDRIAFQVLNIENDPLEQGFEEHGFDLIVAANVLHATTNLNVTLKNSRKLLKPGAKIILLETCGLDWLRVGFTFGLLPGWWLSTESDRQWSPLLTEHSWHQRLSTTDFSGADIALRDYDDQRNHVGSMIISTALEARPTPSTLPRILIVGINESNLQREIASQLSDKLQLSQRCDFVDPRNVTSSDVQQAFLIFLLELEKPYLSNLSTDEYTLLQNIVTSASSILWTTQRNKDSTKTPELGLVNGFARSVRSETISLRFVTLELENSQDALKIADTINKTVNVTLLDQKNPVELEYMEKDDRLHINRIVEERNINQKLHAKTTPKAPELQKFGGGRALNLTIAVPGILDTLRFVNEPMQNLPLSSNDVEIQVKACGVNFVDVMIALGQVADNVLGQECSGVITQVGKNVGGLKVGTRVACVTRGTFRSYVRSNADTVVPIADDIPFSTAASLPAVYCTVYHALFNIARAQKGESILIHCAAGGIGQAAIQLSKILGLEIFVTVGTQDKKKLIIDQYKIREDHIFSSRNSSFARGIQRMTKHRGVDVILNSLSGELLKCSWECIAHFGRFVELGKKDIYAHASLPMWPFMKSSTFAFLDIALVTKEKSELIGNLLRNVIRLFVERKITGPHPQNVYRSSDILDAFRYLQSGRNTGKTIVELCAEDIIPVVPEIERIHAFDEHATYVIAGGFGGLGRSVARWMAQRGARYLVLLSRSGANSDAATELINELEAQGVKTAAPVCDVSRAQSLALALKQCASMPPIKGCVQGSMVLRDGFFGNLSLSDFKSPLAPKVQGSWNLHEQLPRGMDFFVLLSSAAGIMGNRGQSNYASGNTYQDALASYRVANGEKAVSIDLGRVSSVGYVAEGLGSDIPPQVAAQYMRISEAEFHALLDIYCDPSLPIESGLGSQLVIGVNNPASIIAKGHSLPFWAFTPLFNHLTHMENETTSTSGSAATGSGTVDFQNLFSMARSPTALAEVLIQALVDRLSKSLSIPQEDIDVHKAMHRYGIDSLVAVEIRQWFMTEVRSDVTVIDVLESGSIRALAALAAERSELVR